MKLQISGLCLAEHAFQQFRITPPRDFADKLKQEGMDLKAYLRDDIRRRLRRAFGSEPWFFFAIEDRSLDGKAVQAHIHGSVLVQPLPLPRTRAGDITVMWRRRVARDGMTAAELAYGRRSVKQQLHLASKPDGRPNAVWSKEPLLGRSNPDWISYALKNMAEPSADLPVRRMVLSRPLGQEARRLWELIRCGEPALSQWNGTTV